MITITQYFHFPNNTELGKGNTHECYLLIPNSYDLSKIFPSGEEITVSDVSSNRKYYLKSAQGREFRINQMGQFYRDYDVHMGDEIIITHVEGVDKCTYIDVDRHQRVVIKQGHNGGEIINIDRLAPYKKGNLYEIPIVWNEQELILNLQFKASLPKRNDSPNLTDYYSVTLGNNVLQNGSYLLSIGEKNELSFFEKTDLRVFPFDETIIGTPNKTSKKFESESDLPIQIIFYGAPGTGKSHEVKKRTGELLDNGEEQDLPNVFRTTFHPDTDYASFVGCYKPTMKPTSKEEKTLTGKDEEIVYEFVPQAFTDAYTYAYTHSTEQTYLVIEEINRGNCAQIFGDLFQSLDRKDGKSEYKIKADKDLANYLIEKLGEDSEGIKEGKLCLPANLSILATMNTSDQSLFPIDSAFKRRWEWKYLPINNHEDKNYKIEIGSIKYDWWGFLSKINQVIGDTTSSEDKKLGYFFAKANEKGIVTAEQFVGKVLFYLWNDVFKNYGFDNQIFDKGNKKKFDFSEFFKQNGSPDTDMVNMFLRKLDETIDKENSFVEKAKDEDGQGE